MLLCAAQSHLTLADYASEASFAAKIDETMREVAARRDAAAVPGESPPVPLVVFPGTCSLADW